MIGISKLYCGAVEPSDVLRYGREAEKLPSHLLQFSKDKRPVVVWNVTQRCNLKCVHCYSNSNNILYGDELTTKEGKRLLSDLSLFGAPVILFSGGEPLMREDLTELAQFAVDLGMRAVISTNGTLLTKKQVDIFKRIGLSYVGVSLDGMKEIHDRFRGVAGAFDMTMKGIRICQDAGIKLGIRFTLNRKNVSDIPSIFDLIEKENIPRACFYHLVYSGRGSKLIDEDLSHGETRKTVDLIMDRTRDFFDRGKPKEILTVDNHADGPYVYLRLQNENQERAAEVMTLLLMNEGNNSGTGIGCISWNGDVHADQFWRNISFGNVRIRPFSEIWTDTSNKLMRQLKDKKKFVKGRCATCRWLNICGGNFRARAEAVSGEIWAPDPACYLTEEEIRQDENFENIESLKEAIQ
jgi:12,18-didecarboxysiroheme deacetylase